MTDTDFSGTPGNARLTIHIDLGNPDNARLVLDAFPDEVRDLYEDWLRAERDELRHATRNDSDVLCSGRVFV